jgi:predicted O-methyltransferase YrrM
MKAEKLQHWITGSAYNYADGDIWPEIKFHTPLMVVWRVALKLRLRSRIACRERGDVWPAVAATMIGKARAQNIVDMVRYVNSNKVPGALVDCGVWRGGSTILMTQAAIDDGGRQVFCCDTFDGFPPHQATAEQVACPDALRVPVADVKHNFDTYGVPTTNVTFLSGDVCTTLGGICCSIALLRIDVDMYEPTMACLEHLYIQIQPGGVVIIDDYGCGSFKCKEAVDEFRRKNACGPLNHIDLSGVWWVKP